MVWQRSKDLAVHIYKMTSSGKFASDFGLRDQIRRASVSIPSNIAEGDESGSNKQAVKFFNIAKGSNAEVLTQAVIAFEIGYISKDQFESIESESNIIGKMLTKLIQARK
jgi:four helix bundle protein